MPISSPLAKACEAANLSGCKLERDGYKVQAVFRWFRLCLIVVVFLSAMLLGTGLVSMNPTERAALSEGLLSGSKDKIEISVRSAIGRFMDRAATEAQEKASQATRKIKAQTHTIVDHAIDEVREQAHSAIDGAENVAAEVKSVVTPKGEPDLEDVSERQYLPVAKEGE